MIKLTPNKLVISINFWSFTECICLFYMMDIHSPTLPRGKPKLMDPDLESLRIGKFENALKHWTPLFTPAELQWWETYASKIKRMSTAESARKRYVAENAVWLLPNLPIQLNEPAPEEEPALPPAVAALLNAETEDPEVEVVRRRNQPQPHGRPNQRQQPNRGNGGQANGRRRGNDRPPQVRRIFLSYVYMYNIAECNKQFILLTVLNIITNLVCHLLLIGE